MRASAAEGVLAEVVGACSGGAVLTGWAMRLGCSAWLIGLLGALPFCGQIVQLPAARAVSRFGARRVALVSVALSRQAFLPLALLPFFRVGPGAARALLVGAAVAQQAFGIAANNGWVDWMGELVPARVRGRYFGRRMSLCTAAGALASLGAGALLDRAPGENVLAALALITCLAGVASVWLMSRQAGGRPRPRRAGVRPRQGSLLAVLRAPAAGRYAVLVAVAGGGAGLMVPFSSLYVLRDRAQGFTFLAAYGAVSAVARIGSSGRWGGILDRRGGARAVMASTAALLAASPLLWIAAAAVGPWVFAVEAVSGGVAAQGFAVAGLSVPLAISPKAERPLYGAVFALAGGLTFAIGTLLATPLAALWPARAAFAGPLTAPFIGSAVLRALAAALALRFDLDAGAAEEGVRKLAAAA